MTPPLPCVVTAIVLYFLLKHSGNARGSSSTTERESKSPLRVAFGSILVQFLYLRRYRSWLWEFASARHSTATFLTGALVTCKTRHEAAQRVVCLMPTPESKKLVCSAGDSENTGLILICSEMLR